MTRIPRANTDSASLVRVAQKDAHARARVRACFVRLACCLRCVRDVRPVRSVVCLCAVLVRPRVCVPCVCCACRACCVATRPVRGGVRAGGAGGRVPGGAECAYPMSSSFSFAPVPRP